MNAQISCLSQISQVTVYARGALVRRRVAVPPADALPAGDIDLIIDDITPLAEPGSVRAAAPPGSRPIVAVQSALIVPASAIPVGPSEARVHELEGLLNRLGLAIERLQTQRQSLAALQPDPRLRTTSLLEKVDERMVDALATAELLGGIQGELDLRLQELLVTQTQARKELEAARLVQAQASTDLRPDRERQRRRVTVRLGSGGPLTQLELLYVVPAARFWPIYTLRISEGGRRATWLIEALCAQRSTEDWRDVRLGLSTADLIYDARLPELPSLRLGRAQPPARRGYRPAPEGLERMFSGYDRAFASSPPPAAAPAREPSPALEDDALDLPVNASAAASAGLDRDQDESAGAPVLYRQTQGKGRGGEVSAAKLGELRDELRKKESSTPPRSGAPPRPAANTAPPPPPPPLGGYGAPPGMPPPAQAVAAPLVRGEMMRMRQRMQAPLLSSAAADGGFGGGGEPGNFPVAPEPEPAGSEPPDAWLDFDHLSMAGPTDASRRGRLTLSGEPEAGLRQQAVAQLESLLPSDRLVDPQLSRGRFDHRYDADGLVAIPADGLPHRVALLCAETVPALRLLTVPGERPEVYREAELQNPCEAPLLSGPVDVYVEGSLLTTAGIDHIDRGGTLRVGMGVEDRVRVARNVRSDEDTAGLLGGSMVVTHTVSIELSSALGQPSTVEVLERLPVSDDKAVTVEFIAARPEAASYTQAERGAPIRGGLQWRIPLSAAGKAKIEYQYRIIFPAKTEIVGGNRRD